MGVKSTTLAQLSQRRRRPGLAGLRAPAHPVTAVARVPVIPTASSTNARVSPRRIHINPETDFIANRGRLQLGSSAAAQPPSSHQTGDPAAPDCRPSCSSTRAISARCRAPAFLPPTLPVPPPLPVRVVDRPPGERRRSSSRAKDQRPNACLRSRDSPGHYSGESPARARGKQSRRNASRGACACKHMAEEPDRQRWRRTARA